MPVNIPLAEAKELHLAALNGEPEAVAFFKTCCSPDDSCFICGQRAGEDARVGIYPDPTHKGAAMLWPNCKACMSLPAPDRQRLELKMLRSMWPKVRWRVCKDADPAYRRNRKV